MATEGTDNSEPTTLEQLRAQSDSQEVSDGDLDAAETGNSRHQWDFLGLIDIEAFAKIQFANSGPVGKSSHLGTASLLGSLLLGRGGSFTVRRVPYSAISQSLNSWEEPFEKSKGFVVIKQPIARAGEPLKVVSEEEKDFKKRLWDAMMELKVSYHKPLRKHPNIVKFHALMWDTQSNLGTALAPSLIMEYADLGTLSDFQNSKKLILHADAKSDICLDVARGLLFLHKCGIIHGDVKCDNIFLFRCGIHEKSRATGILAKVGDFGSSLIGVLEERGFLKQTLPAHTNFWDAPEKALPMDACGLRRTDIYSYGLAVWKVMSNGSNPFQSQFGDLPPRTIVSKLESSPKTQLKVDDILSIKQNGDTVLHLAVQTLQNRPKSDLDLEKTRRVLEATVRQDPTSRASSFEEIVNIWCSNDAQIMPLSPQPEPLVAGDFGITNANFPHYIYLMRTTPSSFRSLICSQLSQNAKYCSTDSLKASYHLALAVCHFQSFFPKDEDCSKAMKVDHIALGASEILKSAALGNPIAQSLSPPAYFSIHGSDTCISSQFLTDATRQGSIRARYELKELFPAKHAEIVASIQESRHQFALSLTSASHEAYGSDFFDRFSSLDPVANSVLSNPCLSRLHQAAYLGNLEVCKELIDTGEQNVDVLSASDETPLHYAVLGGHAETTRYLLSKGANINAQRKHGAGPLHLAFSSHRTDEILEVLLSMGANPHISSSDALEDLSNQCDYLMNASGTPLHFAIRCGNIEAASLLLEAGADPNKKSDFILSPLQLAIQTHSMPLLELMLPWAIKNETLPDVRDICNSLVGFYAQPIFRWVYWTDKSPLDFILPAVALIKGHQLGIDERVLLSWALDADDTELVEHFLKELFSTDRAQLKPFRDPRPNSNYSLGGLPDVPLSPDLKQVLSTRLIFSNKEIIRTLLSYMEPPVSSCDNSGTPFIYQLAFRQPEAKEEINAIVALLVKAGIDIRAENSQPELGPLRNAATWNNSNLADVLLENSPSPVDIQAAMEVCFGKGESMIAGQILRSILEKFPQVLVTPLPKEEEYIWSPSLQPDYNYLRALCSREQLSTQVTLRAGMLSEIIQHTKGQPGGHQALQERLRESSFLKYTPLHYAALNGNCAAAEILLNEGANINAYDTSPITGSGFDFSATDCTIDMSTLDDLQKLMLSSASGPTPLDQAYARDWESSLLKWPSSSRELIEELRFAGGAFKEEAAYVERTEKMVGLLRARSGKTRDELFGIPNQHLTRRHKYEPKLPSETSQRISRLWAAACGLHSAPNTMYKYPNLLSRSDPARPRFSALFAESIDRFARIAARLNDIKEDSLRISCEAELLKYQSWSRRNSVEERNLDLISDLPSFGKSIILAAAIYISLSEIICTLGYLEEVLMDPQDLIDRKYRCQQLLKDLGKVIGALNTEEMSLKALSDLAVAEAEEELHIKVEEIDMDGNPKPK